MTTRYLASRDSGHTGERIPVAYTTEAPYGAGIKARNPEAGMS